MERARAIAEFWFGHRPMSADALRERMPVWFGDLAPAERRARDDLIRTRFGDLIDRAAAGELEPWRADPGARLSLILLLDQFPRNVYRGTRRAFAHDAAALRLTTEALESGADRELSPVEKIFLYMPLQHAESLDAQDRSVAAYGRLLEEAPEAMRASFLETLQYAKAHRAIVERFGRFPHRNRVLERDSTPAEREYLRTAGSFGQDERG